MVVIQRDFLQQSVSTVSFTAMRRFTSLLMIAALLSVSSLPMLPQTPACHAAEANAACDTCHPQENMNTTAHDMHAHMMHGSGMEMQQSMDHNNHGDHDAMMRHDSPKHSDHDQNHHDHQNIEQPKEMHKHQKQLSAVEKECRIECGCGCNRSVDGFPQVLSPHIVPVINFETVEQVARIEPESFPALQSFIEAVPPPPPKQF